MPHPRTQDLHTHATPQQPLPCAAPSCGQARRDREQEGERERKDERHESPRESETDGNTGRCTWKLCGAVKPRRLLFTICREHTKFIRRDHTTSIDMREADRFSERALFRARTTRTSHRTIFRRRVVLIVRGTIAVRGGGTVAAIGLDLTITRCVENFVTIDMKINHPTAAM